MKTLQEIVIARLSELGLGPVEAAVQGDLERTYIRDIVKGKKLSVKSDKLGALAAALFLDPEALARNEAVPIQRQEVGLTPKKNTPNASFPPRYQSFSSDSSVPVMGQSVAGPNGRFILNGTEVGRVFMPPMLEGIEDAYAVRVYGTSMEPRYFAGQTVWLNPQEPVRQGDDVVVQIITDEENGRESYIKRFVSRSSKVTRLYQYNPEEGESHDLTFDTETVFSIHKIVFSANV